MRFGTAEPERLVELAQVVEPLPGDLLERSRNLTMAGLSRSHQRSLCQQVPPVVPRDVNQRREAKAGLGYLPESLSDLLEGLRTPRLENDRHQIVQILEMPVEAALRDSQPSGQRLDCKPANAPNCQLVNRRFDPLVSTKKYSCTHHDAEPYYPVWTIRYRMENRQHPRHQGR